MNYRLASETQYAFPIRQMILKASLFLKKLNYSPNYLMGNSAGGHLSMLYAIILMLKKRKGSYQYCRSCRLSDKSFQNYEEYSFVKNTL
jgi:acetyl esterase/lipase